MATVIAREGIAAATLTNVASQAGFHRTLVAHYFGDRRSLIDAVKGDGDPACVPPHPACAAQREYPHLHLRPLGYLA